MIGSRLYTFGKNSKEVMLHSSVHDISGYRIRTYLIVGDVQFDHL